MLPGTNRDAVNAIRGIQQRQANLHNLATAAAINFRPRPRDTIPYYTVEILST